MKWYYTMVLMGLACFSSQLWATSCVYLEDHYVMICQQGDCTDGYFLHEISSGYNCDRRLVVEDLDLDSINYCRQVYQASLFADKPGIYIFSVTGPYHLSQTDRKKYHQTLLGAMNKQLESDKKDRDGDSQLPSEQKFVTLNPHTDREMIHQVYDQASSDKLQAFKDEDSTEALMQLIQESVLIFCWGIILAIGIFMLLSIHKENQSR